MYKGGKPSPTFETIYVAMTRGSGVDCIKWLQTPVADHSFLVGLQPSVNLKVWYNSYDTNKLFNSLLAKKAALAFKLIPGDLPIGSLLI